LEAILNVKQENSFRQLVIKEGQCPNNNNNVHLSCAHQCPERSGMSYHSPGMSGEPSFAFSQHPHQDNSNHHRPGRAVSCAPLYNRTLQSEGMPEATDTEAFANVVRGQPSTARISGPYAPCPTAQPGMARGHHFVLVAKQSGGHHHQPAQHAAVYTTINSWRKS